MYILILVRGKHDVDSFQLMPVISSLLRASSQLRIRRLSPSATSFTSDCFLFYDISYMIRVCEVSLPTR